MNNELATQTEEIESVLVEGDLSKLTPKQRVSYYMSLCRSMKLNELTRPFNYIVLNGKLTLYATKTATDQIRENKSISIDDVNIQENNDNFVVIVKGHDANGRSDVEIGVVSKKDMQGNISNVMMKAVTKAKRRLTLSIGGLGMMDETELETVPTAKIVDVDINTGEMAPPPAQEYLDTIRTNEQARAKKVAHADKVPSNGSITLAMAKEIVGSDGKKYGDCTEKELDGKMIGITRKLNIKNLDDDERDELLYKLDAIEVLIKDFAAKEPVQAGPG